MVTELSSDHVRRPSLDHLLGTPAFFADPYPAYRRLRAEEPVAWSERWGSWVVTRHADVLASLRDTSAFSNVGRQAVMLRRLAPERQAELQPLLSHYDGAGLSNQDPPEHTRLRRLISTAFTPRVVANLAPRIQAIVDGLLDGLATGEPVDLIREVAYPLPAIVIAELLGLPPCDREAFKTSSDELTAFLGAGGVDSAAAERAQQGMLALREYLGRQLALRKAEPQDDLLSRFIAAEVRGEALSDGEVLGSCVTILLGGHETTTNLIGNGMLALLRHPAQLQRVCDDPSLIPAAVEEFLRYDPPVQRVWRLVKDDVEVGGRRLATGESVYLMTGAANRDLTLLQDPDALDVGRQPNRHLTFGHGAHFCPGAPLARLEASIVFGSLLRRFRRIALATERLEHHPNVAFRGLASLPVVLSVDGKGGMPIETN